MSEARLLRCQNYTVGESDCKGIQGRLPTVCPTLAASPGGVQAHDCHIDTLERGGLGREMAAGLDRFTDSGVDALDSVRIWYEIFGCPARALPEGLGSGDRVRGVRRNQLGQADLYVELRARVSTWPPLRLARLRCERESVFVVSARRSSYSTS